MTPVRVKKKAKRSSDVTVHVPSLSQGWRWAQNIEALGYEQLSASITKDEERERSAIANASLALSGSDDEA